MNPNYDASATPTPTARAEKAEAELLLKNKIISELRHRIGTDHMTGVCIKLEAELSKLREDVKPLVEWTRKYNTFRYLEFIRAHPELKEAG